MVSTWPLCMYLLLALGLALPTEVRAQESDVAATSSLDFAMLTPAPSVVTTTPPATIAPKLAATPATTTPKPAAAPATTTPKPVTAPATTAPKTAMTVVPTSTDAGSSSSGDTVVTSTSKKPTVAPTPAPTPVKPCSDAAVKNVTKLYDSNVVLEGDCAVSTNFYRFPFDGVPSKDRMRNMSRTSACAVLMQALLVVVPEECIFKRTALRQTASTILQLAKNLKTKATTDSNLHVLLDKNLLVIGTWNDDIKDPSSDTPVPTLASAAAQQTPTSASQPTAAAVPAPAQPQYGLQPTATRAPAYTESSKPHATAQQSSTTKTKTSVSGSRRLVVPLTLHIALVLAWVLVQ